MQITELTWQQTMPIRHQVLWPDKPIEYCQVEGDDMAEHYGVIVDRQLVSVASIYFDDNKVRLRKFATLPAFQRQGIGSFLLKHILSTLEGKGLSSFWCDARESAMTLYQRIGMQAEGERFYKSEIPYFRMSKTLD